MYFDYVEYVVFRMVWHVPHLFDALVEDVYGHLRGGSPRVPLEQYVPREVLFFPPQVVSCVVLVEGFLLVVDDGVVRVPLVYARVVVLWRPVEPRR